MRMPKSINTVKRQIAAKIRTLGEAGTFMPGSFVEKRWRCAKPECICNRTGRKHTAFAVTGKVKGRTRSVYVPVGMADEVKGWVKEYRRVQKTIKEIGALAEQLIRLQVPTGLAASRRRRSLESSTATSSGA